MATIMNVECTKFRQRKNIKRFTCLHKNRCLDLGKDCDLNKNSLLSPITTLITVTIGKIFPKLESIKVPKNVTKH